MTSEKGNGETPPFGASSSVGSLQFKTIDGLKIHYATNDAAGLGRNRVGLHLRRRLPHRKHHGRGVPASSHVAAPTLVVKRRDRT